MSQRGSLSLFPPFRILQREKRALSSLDPRSFHLSICALCTRQPRPILIVPLGRGLGIEKCLGGRIKVFFSYIRTEAFSLSHFLKRWKRREKSICGSIRANNWLHLNERKSFACLYTNKRIRRIRRSVVVRADFRRPLAPYFHAPNLLYVVYNNGSVCVLTSIFFPVLCCLELCIYSRKKRPVNISLLFFADDK